MSKEIIPWIQKAAREAGIKEVEVESYLYEVMAVLTNRVPVSVIGEDTYLFLPADPNAARYPLPGLTRVMNQVLWRYVPRPPGSSVPPIPRRDLVMPALVFRPAKQDYANLPPMLRMSGHHRGTLVHAHLHGLIRLSASEFMREHTDGAHPIAVNVWIAMRYVDQWQSTAKKAAWMPLRGEVVAHNPQLHMATRLDGAATDARGCLHVWELKTGYSEGRFHRNPDGRHWTLPALKHQACTELARAEMQIALGAYMAAQQWKIDPSRMRLWVIRADQHSVEFYRITPARHAELLNAALPTLFAHAQAKTIGRPVMNGRDKNKRIRR